MKPLRVYGKIPIRYSAGFGSGFSNFKHITMKKVIQGLIEYAQDPKHAEEGENYISDGEMLDMLLDQLEKIIKQL